MSCDRESERWAKEGEKERNVCSCDVSSADRAAMHTVLPINILKWINNATPGALTDLKLLSQTLRNKTYYFNQFPQFVKKVNVEATTTGGV